MDLVALGWNEHFATAFAPYAERGLVPARVTAGHRGAFQLATADGPALAKTAGKLLHEARSPEALPAVGDWIALEPTKSDAPDARGTIHAILPRISKFSRRAAGKRAVEQVVATNIDTVFLVASLDKRVRPRSLERYLMLAWDSVARPVVVLTKSDVCNDTDDARAHAESIAGDVPVHLVSAFTGEGMDALAAELPAGTTGTLLGLSGAGKSTLINHWCGDEAIATGDVRGSDKRGRHTTTYRHLVTLPWGALLIDTPGMRELQLWEGSEGIAEAFSDVIALTRACRFTDCTHQAEPGCAIQSAVSQGELDPARFESWAKLQAEQEAFEEARLAREQATNRRRQGATFKRNKGPKPQEVDPDA